MYRLEVSAAIRHIYMSLGFKSLSWFGTSLLHIKKKAMGIALYIADMSRTYKLP